jgi:hypothetical protein
VQSALDVHLQFVLIHVPRPAQSASVEHSLLGPVRRQNFLPLASAPVHSVSTRQSAFCVQTIPQLWIPNVDKQSKLVPRGMQSAVVAHWGGRQYPLSHIGLFGYVPLGQSICTGSQQSAAVVHPGQHRPTIPAPDDDDVPLALVLAVVGWSPEQPPTAAKTTMIP